MVIDETIRAKADHVGRYIELAALDVTRTIRVAETGNDGQLHAILNGRNTQRSHGDKNFDQVPGTNRFQDPLGWVLLVLHLEPRGNFKLTYQSWSTDLSTPLSRSLLLVPLSRTTGRNVLMFRPPLQINREDRFSSSVSIISALHTRAIL